MRDTLLILLGVLMLAACSSNEVAEETKKPTEEEKNTQVGKMADNDKEYQNFLEKEKGIDYTSFKTELEQFLKNNYKVEDYEMNNSGCLITYKDKSKRVLFLSFEADNGNSEAKAADLSYVLRPDSSSTLGNMLTQSSTSFIQQPMTRTATVAGTVAKSSKILRWMPYKELIYPYDDEITKDSPIDLSITELRGINATLKSLINNLNDKSIVEILTYSYNGTHIAVPVNAVDAEEAEKKGYCTADVMYFNTYGDAPSASYSYTTKCYGVEASCLSDATFQKDAIVLNNFNYSNTPFTNQEYPDTVEHENFYDMLSSNKDIVAFAGFTNNVRYKEIKTYTNKFLKGLLYDINYSILINPNKTSYFLDLFQSYGNYEVVHCNNRSVCFDKLTPLEAISKDASTVAFQYRINDIQYKKGCKVGIVFSNTDEKIERDKIKKYPLYIENSKDIRNTQKTSDCINVKKENIEKFFKEKNVELFNNLYYRLCVEYNGEYWVSNKCGEYNGEPSLLTEDADSITYNTAKIHGSAMGISKDSDWQVGFFYDTNENVTEKSKCVKTYVKDREIWNYGEQKYSTKLKNLKELTKYYYRAFAYSEGKYVLAAETKSFVTKAKPLVQTLKATDVTTSTATLKAKAVNIDDYTNITAGFCYSTKSDFSANAKNIKTNMKGDELSQSLSGLTPNTLYYYKAYIIINGTDTIYGSTLSFTTNGEPAATTLDVSDLTSTSVTLKGSASNVNGYSSVKVGFYYQKSSAWLDHDDATRVSSTLSGGSFAAKLSNLVANSDYKYQAYVEVDGKMHYGEIKSFKTKLGSSTSLCPDDNHPHMIDLGLPSGTKWACCNVGASSPEDYGDYFAWGETSPKSEYTENNSLTYNVGYSSLVSRGIIDSNSGKLTVSYDAATANWGGSWRMPTSAEIGELINRTWKWTTKNGVEGFVITGTNGNSIFLPAAGYRNGTSLKSEGYEGCYWSNSPYDSGQAYYLIFHSGYRAYYGNRRYYGLSVRPVLGLAQ